MGSCWMLFIRQSCFRFKGWKTALSEKILKYLTNHTKDTVALGITQNLKKSVLPADKKGIFNISAQIEETETQVNSDRDWEILDKTKEISVRERLTFIFGKMN